MKYYFLLRIIDIAFIFENENIVWKEQKGFKILSSVSEILSQGWNNVG